MATYIISYDLNKEGTNYSKKNKALIERIRDKFGTFWHHLDSVWIVVTDMSAVEIRDYLNPILDSNDELLVVKSGREAAWKGFSDKGSQWLVKHL